MTSGQHVGATLWALFQSLCYVSCGARHARLLDLWSDLYFGLGACVGFRTHWFRYTEDVVPVSASDVVVIPVNVYRHQRGNLHLIKNTSSLNRYNYLRTEGVTSIQIHSHAKRIVHASELYRSPTRIFARSVLLSTSPPYPRFRRVS